MPTLPRISLLGTKTSDALKAENGGEPMPSLLFQHIPVPEIYELLKEVPKGTDGAVKKTVSIMCLIRILQAVILTRGRVPQR